MVSDRLSLRVTDIFPEAKDVVVVELRDPQGRELPPFSAGAHVEIILPGGIIRHYSLCNDMAERHRYCIGVGRARESRGGSIFIHQSLRVGDVIAVAPPRNNFPMVDGVARHDFIAGGIGITPIMAMIRACEATGAAWSLTYLVRNRQRAAFLEELSGFGDRIHIHADDEANGFPDIPTLLDRLPPDSALYCCGPAPLMKGVEQAASDRPPELLRFEWFTPKALLDDGPKGAFTVQLARSGKTIVVPPDRTILEALEDNGIEAPFACREGICGSCEVAVLAGIPDHRDSVLSPSEQARNDTMMTCCSRALSSELVLDI